MPTNAVSVLPVAAGPTTVASEPLTREASDGGAPPKAKDESSNQDGGAPPKTNGESGVRSRALVSVFVAVVVDWMGVSLTQPIMPFFITEVLHGPPWSVGCLYAIFASVQIFGTPLLGWASDVYGRRPLLLISLAGTSSGYILSALASDYRWLLFARGLRAARSRSLSLWVTALYICRCS